jgi:uncharacterized membrane protein
MTGEGLEKALESNRTGPHGGKGSIDMRGEPMKTTGRMWAIGYDDVGRAAQVREEIIGLGWDRPYLILEDIAVVIRHPDGTFTLDRETIPAVAHVMGLTLVGLLAGLVTAMPLTGAALGAVVGGINTAVAAAVRIDAEFIRDVEQLMKPGTSVLFILDDQGDMDVILHSIRGLGGTILKTNVDLERARLIQSALTAAPDEAIRTNPQ